MNFYEANQEDFDAINRNNLQGPTLEAIPRCRCQPNTCSRPVCSGCVQCLVCRRIDLSNVEQTKLLADFLTF